MSKAQLPLLTSVIMVTQAFISAPAGIRAKRSIKDRNQVLLFGYAAMIAADLTFAFLPTVYGEHSACPPGTRLFHPGLQFRSLLSWRCAMSCSNAQLKEGHVSQCDRASHCLREMGALRDALHLAWQAKKRSNRSM